jgi:hypothetical protein
LENSVLDSSKNKLNRLSTNESTTTSRLSLFTSGTKNTFLNILKGSNYTENLLEKHLVINLDSINIDEVDEEGRNIFHRACFQLKFQIVESLIEKICKHHLLNKLDNYNNTALILACKVFKFKDDNESRFKILELLLEKGINLDLCEDENGWTALHWLCFIGDENSMKYLIEKGAVYFAPDKKGYFPIDLAGYKGHKKIALFIIQEFLELIENLGENLISNGEVIDPRKLNLQNYNPYIKFTEKNLDFELENKNFKNNEAEILSSDREIELSQNLNISQEQQQAKIFSNNLDPNNNKNFHILNLLKSKNKNSQNLNTHSGLENDINQINNNSMNSLSISGYEITTNLELFEPVLQTVLFKIMIHHCLYWACYFKFNNLYINKLLTLCKAKPDFDIFCLNKQTPIHGACADGNLMALKLLLSHFNQDLENVNVNFNYQINEVGREQENFHLNIQKNNHFILKNMVLAGYSKYQDQKLKNYKNIITRDPRFKILNRKYKQYLIDKMYYFLFSIETKSHNCTDILELLDLNLNNPIHLASINGKIKFLKELFSSNILETNIHKLLNTPNKDSYSGYALLKDENLRNKIMTMAGQKIYKIPAIVLELQKEEKTKPSINLIMKIATAEKLQVALVEHQDKDKIYLCIDISETEFKKQAEKAGIKIKLLDKSLKKAFENKDEFINSVEPFYSRMRQEVISKVISNILDLKLLLDQKILVDIIFLHKPNAVLKIKKTWLNFKWYLPTPFNLFKKIIFNGKEIINDEIDILYRYFGEKIAIYHTFNAFIINYLVFISFIGLVNSIYYREKIFTSNSIFPTYAVMYLIWSTLFVEMWKRKISEITHKWGVNDISNERELRSEFKGDEYYKDLNGKLEKHYETSKTIFLFLLNVPIIIGLLAAVILIFQYGINFENMYKDNSFLKYVPGLIKSISLTIVSAIYDRVARYFNNLENHKYEDSYENSMIAKVFTFRLVADLTAVVYTIISDPNPENLKALLYNLIVVKIVTGIGTKIILPYMKLNFIKKRYFNNVREKSKNYEKRYLRKNLVLRMKNVIEMPDQNDRLNLRDRLETIEKHEEERINFQNNHPNYRKKISNSNFNKLGSATFMEQDNNTIQNNQKRNTGSIENATNDQEKNSQQNEDDFIINGAGNQDVQKEKIPNNSSVARTFSIVGSSKIYRKVKLISEKMINPFTKNSEDSLSQNNTDLNSDSSPTMPDMSKINPDYIELNNLLQEREELIYLYADISIIYTICSLFAIIIPLAPFIMLVLLTISYNLRIYADLYIFKRPKANRANNIGLWLNVFDLISTGAIMFNSFLYYFYNDNQFNTFSSILTQTTLFKTEEEYDFGGGESALLKIALAEHVLIFIKYFMKFIIKDTPSWVAKERDLLMSILEESNKAKEEEHNKSIENVVTQYLEKFNTSIKNRDKKIERREKEIESMNIKLENYISELEKIQNRIKEYEYINKALEQRLEKIKLLKGENANSNDETISKLFNNYKKISTSPNQSPINRKILSPKIKNFNPDNMTIDEYEKHVNFQFDSIFKKIVNSILNGRKIFLESDVEVMRNNINKIYIFHLMKNTFDRVEKEIMTKKFAKFLSNSDNPIILCSLCSNQKAYFYCSTCEEKFCISCKETHSANNLWSGHKIEVFKLNLNEQLEKDQENLHVTINEMDKQKNKSLFKTSSLMDDNMKKKIFRQDPESTQSNRAEISISGNKYQGEKNLKSMLNNLNKKVSSRKNIVERLKLLRESSNIVPISNLSTSKNNLRDRNNNSPHRKKANSASRSPQIKYKSESSSFQNIYASNNNDLGLFLKMENFCFPLQTNNLNYENINYFFNLLYKEYVNNNGICPDNTIDIKKFIEFKIDISAKLNENPMSILYEEFFSKLSNVTLNCEEQFFMNRIAFMKFKQYGAQLNLSKVFECIKRLQSGEVEEKLRILLDLLDINDNRLILKSEFEKLLVCLTVQNHNSHHRVNNLVEEIFGRNLFLKYEIIYSDFLHKSLHRELLCEILQID